MKEDIKSWKEKNGVVITYTVKELLYAIHVKMDKMEERQVSKELFWKVVGAMCSVYVLTITLFIKYGGRIL